MNSNKDRDLPDKKDQGGVRNYTYDSKNPTLQAECIYFYYLKVSNDLKERTRAFFVDRGRPIPRNTMKTEIEAILKDIAAGKLTPAGWDLGDVRWRRKSYIVVVLEHATHKLEQWNAVEFIPDHAFRDGADIRQFAAPFGNISGFYCLNHLNDMNGHNIPHSLPEEIKVVAHHPHRFHIGLTGRRDHSDTGTNMGPPIGNPP